MRRSPSAQSAASAPPACALIVISASRASYSPESRVLISSWSISLRSAARSRAASSRAASSCSPRPARTASWCRRDAGAGLPAWSARPRGRTAGGGSPGPAPGPPTARARAARSRSASASFRMASGPRTASTLASFDDSSEISPAGSVAMRESLRQTGMSAVSTAPPDSASGRAAGAGCERGVAAQRAFQRAARRRIPGPVRPAARAGRPGATEPCRAPLTYRLAW